MHELIASPFVDDYLVLRPGSTKGVKIPGRRYRELRQVAAGEVCPGWLVESVRRRWGLDLSGRTLSETVLVRRPSPYGHGRASYELNLGCNYDCEHCYLGLKQFEGLPWLDRERLLHLLCEAGVLWLQLTGGEPLIDTLFTEVYSLAYELGMMISISSNGSRLSNPRILELLTSRRPYRLTLSVYGASAASYDGLTRRRGSFAKFARGLAAAHEASLPINLNLSRLRPVWQLRHLHAAGHALPQGDSTTVRLLPAPTRRKPMTAIPVEITIRPAESVVDTDEIELVDDLDLLVESSKCSCNAGDDNPY